jgi:Skp family chaperone for outer membrane proteins
VDKAMGWDVEMQQAMIVANQEFREVLSRRLTELADESTDFRAQIAKEAHLNSEQTNRLQHADNSDKLAQLPLTDNQKQRLMTEGLQMALKLEEAQQNYRQQMADAQTKLVESYASQIMPTAKRVATQGGFKVVKIDGDDVLYHDPSTDLTQEVIRDKVKAKPSWEQQPAATQE